MHLKMKGRHLLVGASVVICTALAGFGVIGPAVGEERITSYEVVATVNPDRTVSIREVIDWDFSLALDKHGIFRDIPIDAGVPEQVRVWSPDAPDGTQASSLGSEVRIRIGDPDTVVRGRRRYVLTYVLPEVVKDDRFALDAIGDGWPVPVHDVRITVRGAELAQARCVLGPTGSTDRCPLSDVDGDHRTQIDRLGAHEAVTITGDVVTPRATEGTPVADEATSASTGEALPPFTPRDRGRGARWAAIVAAIGTAVALAAYGWSRHTGRNLVAAGGATEAAFADLSTLGDPRRSGTRLVADQQMADLAGLDFTPPSDVEPWQGAVVLRESIDSDTIGAWFSSQAAHDIVAFTTVGGDVQMRPGPQAPAAAADTAAVLNRAMGSRQAISLGSYDPAFAASWIEASGIIAGWARSSGTFRRRPPTGGASGHGLGIGLAVLGGVGTPLLLALHFLVGVQTAITAVVVAVFVPGVIALAAYRRLVRSLSVSGSATYLRTESFRRFLHDSEAQHVEWAWQNGLLREYSAWAVALGEARAWGRALEVAGVPPVEVDHVHSVMAPSVHSSSFSSSHTAPSSSGGGGGGSGGGGGGGGGGSW